MIILAFLGNPGKKYLKTRHNIGFILGQKLAEHHGIKLGKNEFQSITGTGPVAGKECLFIFPQTYMNESGKAVQKAMKYYNESTESIIAVHDELELKFGDMRSKFAGGHKGHNGIRSIAKECGSPDFHRIRFGVGRPDNPHITIADHVLSNFTSEQFSKIDEIFSEFDEMICSIIEKSEQ